jgi:4-amino-4-deoxy-L-arabinose transferase-like glycosyltransferase
MDLPKRQHRALFLILAGYLFLALTYAVATPPLEASDEYKHYPVVQYIQSTGRLPVLDPQAPGKWLQEGAQPPLYYVIMAGITSWINTEDLEDLHQINPHAFVGNPNQVMNKNLLLHQPEKETIPWQGSVLATYVIRFFTITLGIGTIIIIAQLGKLLMGSLVGLLAAALTAFNPMFLFVHAAVNNDALAILLGTLGLYLLVKLWRNAPDPRRQWSHYVALGVVLGLGLMTKLSLAGLLLLTGLALAWMSYRRRRWRYLLIGGGLVAGLALLISLPWLIRNLGIYGDPIAMEAFLSVQGGRENPITWQDWRGEFGTFYRSFWGLFGGVNIAMPEILYLAYNLLTLAGAAGFIIWLIRDGRTLANTGESQISLETDAPSTRKKLLIDDGLWLLIAWAIVITLLLIRWNFVSPAFQGRLIFPAIGAINILLSIGLLSWARRKVQSRIAVGLAFLVFLVAAIVPWLTIRPAYAFPKPMDSIPQEAMFGPISFLAKEGEIQLVGVEMEPGQNVIPGGDPVEVVLYWQAVQPVEDDYLSAVNILGRENEVVGHVNRFPAWGMLPTSEWKAGQIWRDEYRLFASDDAASPALLIVRIALYDPVEKDDVPAIGPNGLPIELLLVGEARLGTEDVGELSPANQLITSFKDGIALQGYDLDNLTVIPGDSRQLTLYWLSDNQPSLDYTVFIHLVDANGMQVANADSPPVGGYYPTHLWRAGEQIVDEHVLTIPAELKAGEYGLVVGMYDPESGHRLGEEHILATVEVRP